MTSHSMTNRAVHLLLAIIICCGGPTSSVASSAATQDPLSRPEFDLEVTVDLKDVPVLTFFRILSRLTSVPFVVEFEDDPGLRITLNAKNMVSRGLLASLASTYGLVFGTSPEGVVVRRPGFPPASKATIVGAWPVVPGESYQFDLLVRDATGKTVSTPRIALRRGVVGSVKQGSADIREVATFDRARNIIEPRHVGGVEVAFSVKNARSVGLDVIVELVVSRPLSGGVGYSEARTVTEQRITAPNTVLAKSPDGLEFVLTNWATIMVHEGARPE